MLAASIWGDAELDLIRLVLKGACFAKSGRWNLALRPLEDAYNQGCRDVFGIRWYALTLLATLQFKPAVTILEEWLTMQPENSEAKSYLAAAQQPGRFGEMLKRIHDSHLRTLGVAAEPISLRKPGVRIDDAIREMIQSSGSFGGKITGFKPQPKKIES
jgi:hypothetical protein